MTAKTQSYSDFQTRWTRLTDGQARTPAANSVLPQLAVTRKIEADCRYYTFMLGEHQPPQNHIYCSNTQTVVPHLKNPHPQTARGLLTPRPKPNPQQMPMSRFFNQRTSNILNPMAYIKI